MGLNSDKTSKVFCINFYHMLVSPGDTPGAITLNVVRMERELDSYKLSRGMYPSIFNSSPVIRTGSAKIAVFT